MMKLCLLIVAAVAILTCYALPVPKEEVFAVYPENRALAEQSSELAPVETKPEVTDSSAVAASSKCLTEVVGEKQVECERVEPSKAASEEVKADSSVKEEVTKTPTLKESADLKVEETPATVASSDNAPTTTVASNDEGRREADVTEPKVSASETKEVKEDSKEKLSAVEDKSAEAKSVVEKEVSAEAARTNADEAAPKKEPEAKSAPKPVEEKKDEPSQDDKSEQLPKVESEVKAVVGEQKLGKLTEEPKVAVVPEATTQVRAASSDVPAEKSNTESVVEATDKPVVKDVSVPEEVTKPVVEQVKETDVVPVPEVKSEVTETETKSVPLSANDPEPKTEGEDEVKPTKVRAAPIVEGLKVAQPVEAEPAIAKIHVTVIQEEFPLEKEALQDSPVSDAGEEVSTESATTSVPDVKTTDVESLKMVLQPEESQEKKSTDASVETPSEVKTTETTVKSESEVVKVVDDKKDASTLRSAALEAEPVVIVVPSVKSDEVTMVVVVAENTGKPTEEAVKKTEEVKSSVEDKPDVPEVRSAVASDDLPEPATTAKVEEDNGEQLAKAADGSSKPGASDSSDTVKDEAKDQGDSLSTTVSNEQDTTTVSPVTEAEPVPTPAKQKAKKQVPPNLKGYSKRLKLQEAQRKQSSDNE